MIPTIKVKDLYSVSQKTERDCFHFYCKCNRDENEIYYAIIGEYFVNANINNALVRVYDNVTEAMDTLDELRKRLKEAKEKA